MLVALIRKCDLKLIFNRARDDPMKKFVVLYMASGPEFEKRMKNSTPE